MRLPLFAVLVCSLRSLPSGSSAQSAPAASVGATPTAIATAIPIATPTPILVELFTSEGCSDCPPADALLRQINGTHTASRQQIVVLSEHVTYWDGLGWKDNFSDVAFTFRQNGYSGKFNLDSVYTPQMVVNGSRQFVGNNVQALRDALNTEVPRDGVALQIVSITPTTNSLSIHFSADHVSGNTPLDVMAALTDDSDESHVARGENGGRTLTHVAVARSLNRIAEIRGNTEQTVRLPWPVSLAKSPAAPRHLLLFVQAHNFGRIVGVTTRPLPLPERSGN